MANITEASAQAAVGTLRAIVLVLANNKQTEHMVGEMKEVALKPVAKAEIGMNQFGDAGADFTEAVYKQIEQIFSDSSEDLARLLGR